MLTPRALSKLVEVTLCGSCASSGPVVIAHTIS
jgi:hypothetical protein